MTIKFTNAAGYPYPTLNSTATTINISNTGVDSLTTADGSEYAPFKTWSFVETNFSGTFLAPVTINFLSNIDDSANTITKKPNINVNCNGFLIKIGNFELHASWLTLADITQTNIINGVFNLIGTWSISVSSLVAQQSLFFSGFSPIALQSSTKRLAFNVVSGVPMCFCFDGCFFKPLFGSSGMAIDIPNGGYFLFKNTDLPTVTNLPAAGVTGAEIRFDTCRLYDSPQQALTLGQGNYYIKNMDILSSSLPHIYLLKNAALQADTSFVSRSSIIQAAEVGSVIKLSGGSGYTTATVIFPASSIVGGRTALGTAVVAGGEVTDIIIDDPGEYLINESPVPDPVVTGDGIDANFITILQENAGASVTALATTDTLIKSPTLSIVGISVPTPPAGDLQSLTEIFSGIFLQFTQFQGVITNNYTISDWSGFASTSSPPKRTWYLNAAGNKIISLPNTPLDGEEHEFYNLYVGVDFFGIAIPNGLSLSGGLFHDISGVNSVQALYVDITTSTTVFEPANKTKPGQYLTLKYSTSAGGWLIGSNFGYTF